MSVTELIQPFVDTRQQFVNLDEGWKQFLFYLRDRRGADIRGVRRVNEIEDALEFVEGGGLQDGASAMNPDAEFFRSFERRDDVLAAFQQFLKHRGLAD